VTGFSGKRPVLLVIGGSQGAQALNTVVTEHLEKLLLICDIVHITGRGKGSAKTHGRYVQKEVVFEELQHLYALADLVVSRAGAGAIAELSALGKPTILVPLPDLAHRHQEENAHFLEVASAVVVLPQENLRKNFVSTVQNLLEDDETRRMLGERLQRFAVPDAADRIANVILETARK
jgi:UDP-N-acetylglucosamine--N-acetylmuramyl-(pentapeptide) pyrophosphoryl-undecaprenol N-acetylglucosamine transferase